MALPGTWTIVYDGTCRFCTTGATRLARSFPRGRVELVDYHQSGALDRFPGLTHEACAAAMHLVDPAGRVYRGAEAAVRAFAARGGLRRFAFIYYTPGLRWALDRFYRLVAANRHRIMGRTESCASGACRIKQPGAR